MKELADKHGIKCMETSAKNSHNVELVRFLLVFIPVPNRVPCRRIVEAFQEMAKDIKARVATNPTGVGVSGVVSVDRV